MPRHTPNSPVFHAFMNPWTDIGLRALDTMVSYQQQAWDQWYRMVSAASSPPLAAPRRSIGSRADAPVTERPDAGSVSRSRRRSTRR